MCESKYHFDYSTVELSIIRMAIYVTVVMKYDQHAKAELKLVRHVIIQKKH